MNKINDYIEEKGISPVIGVILLVAVTVALVTLTTVIIFDLGSDTSEPADVSIQVEQTDDGINYNVLRNSNVEQIRVTGPDGYEETFDVNSGDSNTISEGAGSYNIVAITDSGSEQTVRSTEVVSSEDGETLSGSGSINPPIKGATLKAYDDAGTILDTSTTNDEGQYEMSVPSVDEVSKVSFSANGETDYNGNPFYGTAEITEITDNTVNFEFNNTKAKNVTVNGKEITMANTLESENEPDVVPISTLTELQAMDDDLDQDYKLINDIDATETESWNSGDGFNPIGDNTDWGGDNFTGTLDGQNYTIDGLHIDRPDKPNVGLIARFESGEISNLGLENVNITGNNNVGGLAGNSDGGTIINNTYSDGTINGNDTNIGGLLGRNYGNINNSYSTGEVTSDGDNVGGLIGYGEADIDNNNGNIDNSYSTSNVTGNDSVGGFIGDNNGKINSSFSAGEVTGNSNVGGFSGVSDDNDISDSYWDTESSNQGSSSGGTGLTTSEMTGDSAESNMTGFDFTGTWNTNSDDYPGVTSSTDDGSTDDSTDDGSTDSTSTTDVTGSVSINPDISDANVTAYESGSVVDTATTDSNGNYTLSVENTSKARIVVSVEGDIDYNSNPLYAGASKDVDGSETVNFNFDENETVTSTINGSDKTVAHKLEGSSTNQIANIHQLQAINESKDSNYTLVQDVDASGTSEWNSGSGFNPIASAGNGFKGSFDGRGHSITGLYVRSVSKKGGLFATINSADVENVRILEADIDGGTDNTAGIAVGEATESSKISNVQTTGDVFGHDAGGVVGLLTMGASADNVYSSANVDGSDTQIGGIAAYSGDGDLRNAYFTGTSTNEPISGETGSSSPTDTYWDINATGISSNSEQGTGLTTDEMQGDSAKKNMDGFNFTDTWSTVSNDYPVLNTTSTDDGTTDSTSTTDVTGTVSINPDISGANVTAYESGSVVDTATTDSNGNYTLSVENTSKARIVVSVEGDIDYDGNPLYAGASRDVDGSETVNFNFDENRTVTSTINGSDKAVSFNVETGSSTDHIANVHQLQAVNESLSSDYAIVQDIDATETEDWNVGKGFKPIGGEGQFSGEFVGYGHEINALTINRSNKDYIGLFGNAGNNFMISDVGMTNVDITGNNTVGGLVALSSGGEVNTTYLTGDITANDGVGGVVGNGSIIITESYTTIYIDARYNTGSFVGRLTDGYVNDSYWDTESTNQVDSIGKYDSDESSDVTALTTSEMTGDDAELNMDAFNFTDTWSTVSDDYPQLQWQE